MIVNKEVFVGFTDERLLKEFNGLKFSNLALYIYLDRAFDELKINPRCGIHLPRRIIPKSYKQQYDSENIWKYNLPDGWRLIYYLNTENNQLRVMVLEWLKHSEYERRFNY